RQSPHVLRKGRRKVVVDVSLENKKENAYNASLRLRFSRNLHFSSLVLQVQNLGCYPVQNLTLRMALPALGYRGAAFLSVTRVIADNVTPWGGCRGQGQGCPHVPPRHPASLRRQNCSNAGCQVLRCELGRLERGGELSVHVLRAVHDAFFRAARFRSVKIISTVSLLAPAGGLLLLERTAQRREV
ncbi:ITA10 protein, partial [Casuarius casuarius]|nr:ITA10 protein [Casuarius casuarius]